jgi:predicted SnoaL-like aldol condensation-catalyzing enzyme
MNSELEINKNSIRILYNEIINKGNSGLIDEIFDENYISHGPFPTHIPDFSSLEKFFGLLDSAFPDLTAEIEDIIAEGDKVSYRAKLSGTHKGEFMKVKPTNRSFSAEEFHIVRLREGKIIEHWGILDVYGIFKQLGIIKKVEHRAEADINNLIYTL